MNIYPYVYRLDHPVTGEFYIGYRESNTLPAEQDLGHKYFTSSKYVKQRFNEFNYQIIATFFDPNDAYDFEQEMIFLEWDNPLILNKHCTHGKNKWRLTKEGKRKISQSKIGRNNPNFNKIYTTEEKEKHSKWMKDNNPFRGKKHSTESLHLMSNLRKEHIAANGNPMLGKTHTLEAKKKISDSKLGRKMPPKTSEAKKNLSDALKGKPKSESHKEALRKPKTKVVCRVSDRKEMTASNFSMWLKHNPISPVE